MRSEPSVLHLDLDAFFAAVEQRDKPSLRGKPVIVGGIGARGVVSTASYEARTFGIRSAMRTGEARSRCAHAAYLTPRFSAYKQASLRVMGVLARVSTKIEPLSLDEAFVDLAAGDHQDLSPAGVEAIARRLKAEVREVTGGLTASVGAGSSKLIAKIASDLGKPDGLVVIAPGSEVEFLHPMAVNAIPGVGPATAERLRRVGVHTVGELDRLGEAELVALLGRAHGRSLARLARADDDRPVEPSRESKSVSVEDTFERDVADPAHLDMLLSRIAAQTAERLVRAELSGRTITVKIRLYDFTTHTRSATLPGPTDDVRVITRMARRLLGEVDTSAGVRLLGVGVSGLADWVQDDLFAASSPPLPRTPTVEDDRSAPESPLSSRSFLPYDKNQGESTSRDEARVPTENPSTLPREGTDVRDEKALMSPADPPRRFAPGLDVWHTAHGPGWVWGAGLGRVTVRFETAETGPGPIRTFATDDLELALYTPWTSRLR